MRVKSLAAGAVALGSLFVLVAPGSGAGAAKEDPSSEISSDGSIAPVIEAGGTVSRPSVGTGGPTVQMKVNLSGFAPMTANGRVEVGTESIIGTDSRVRVNPTTSYPARATVLITFNTPQGGSRCTGWFINRNTVATAGHCVHRGTGLAEGFYAISSYRIYPGYNGSVAPYGVCTARRLSTVTGWADNDRIDDEYDYATIKLSTACDTKGNQTGWFGYTTAVALNQGTVISGYPGDKPLTQWRSSDRVRVLQTRRVFYQNDTVGGMSGSAVVGPARPNCNPCAVAVHAYGVYGSPPFSTNNHGTRITSAVFNNFQAWSNAA
jgi:glutamyl endopeptidase